eukprot:3934853-Pleurochrysis_carterae.AAC.1
MPRLALWRACTCTSWSDVCGCLMPAGAPLSAGAARGDRGHLALRPPRGLRRCKVRGPDMVSVLARSRAARDGGGGDVVVVFVAALA